MLTLVHQTKYVHIKTKFAISSIYLVLSSLKLQGRLRTKVYYKFFYFARKETTKKTSRVLAAKTYIPSVYVTDTTCLD